jgi:riboflavin synthase
MFTGIIEAQGLVKEVLTRGSNKTFWVESPLSPSFRPDQSVSHDGVCLTVEELGPGSHRVTAIAETLQKSVLGHWVPGSRVNLERCLRVDSRLDGHFVQGHVDARGRCVRRKDRNGSLELEFEFPRKFAPLVVEKGSICINGISLTAFDVKKKRFRVALIPYTSAHTNIGEVREGSLVNLEFDLLGKYLQRSLSLKAQ